ncbi:SCO6880 family protein [Acidipropionibacterium timonense]|uniref:SCO6880 family protein n=1 Tax=Acidipropionibacterium timonense TaxID=2161818 RepID=UPI00103247FA|nr:SCO6880 family protein [Acidipropionibacterium timonense]
MSEGMYRPRTYGGWHRPSTTGIAGLSSLATGVLLGTVVVTVLVQRRAGIVGALVVAATGAAVVAAISVRDADGRTIGERAMGRINWWRTRMSGSHGYRSGALGRTRWGTCQLPGVLAPSTLLEAQDGYGRPFAIIRVPSVRHYAVVFAAQPDGESLVDPSQIDVQVARWGQWLAGLGEDPSIVGASVCVETVPDTGRRLRREVETHVDESSAQIAREMMDAIVAELPVGSAQIRAWVTVTWTATTRGGRRMEADEMCRDIAAKVPGLSQGLGGTGAGQVVPVDAARLAQMVRAAYDPAAGPLFEDAAVAGQHVEVDWAQAGPMSAVESWDHYVHDSGLSVTWEMNRAPSGLVRSATLARLLGPDAAVPRKRVTVLYRPVDIARTAAVAEAGVNHALVRARSTHDPSARVLRARDEAIKTAAEEAAGAGLEDFAMLVTATASPDVYMPDLVATVESLGAASRVRLRRVYGSQAAAFAMGLPVGLVPSAHSDVPEFLRRWAS